MPHWESQRLSGVLEGLPPMSVPLPHEPFEALTERLQRFREVDIPDWLESDPSMIELHTVFIWLDTWAMIIESMRRNIVGTMSIR